MRLAEHVAHTTDYQAMLSGMTHEQFNMWCAKDIVEPIGNQGTHEILVRLSVLLATFMGQERVKESVFAFWRQDKKEKAAVSDDVAIAALEATGARVT